jgi:hypothetical protein
MSLKERRPPHVAPQTVGQLMAALQEYPENLPVAVRTGTRGPSDEEPGTPTVRALTVAEHGNRNGPFLTL